MNLAEAKALFKEFLTRRRPKGPPNTTALTAATTPDDAWSQAQALLTTTRAAVKTGTCTYMIDTQSFTVMDITQAECDALPNSNFVPD